MKKLLISFLQTGGANALLPLLNKWKSDYNVVITAREPACKNLRRLGFEVHGYPEMGSEAGLRGLAEKWFVEHSPDLLITDTVNLARTPDGALCRQLWGMAVKYGVPSLGYVDCWWGYKERFQLPEETTPPVLPDRIAVVDDLAKDMMRDLGFFEETLIVLGSPRFQMLMNRTKGRNTKLTDSLAGNLGLSPEHFLVLFVSQPLERCAGPLEEWGFTEKTTLSAVLRALDAFPKGTKERLALVIIPHPEEDQSSLRQIVERFDPDIKILFADLDPTLELVAVSDIVLGMNSILLAEAVILQRPVLSVQLNRKREEMLITNIIGATLSVRNDEHLSENLFRAVHEESYRQNLLERQAAFEVVSDACFRWTAQVETLLAGAGSQHVPLYQDPQMILRRDESI